MNDYNRLRLIDIILPAVIAATPRDGMLLDDWCEGIASASSLIADAVLRRVALDEQMREVVNVPTA